MNTEWIARAACSGQTELFFAPAGERAGKRAVREAQALTICAVCPVRVECGIAGADEEHGIWGGTVKAGL